MVITKRGNVKCIPLEYGYSVKISNGEWFHFNGGEIYTLNINDNEVIYNSKRYGDIVIPIDEFNKNFRTEEEDFQITEEQFENHIIDLGGCQNMYGVYLHPYHYRIFINAYPVKNSKGEWVLPLEGIVKNKPMFSFETDAFAGCGLMDRHPDTPVMIGINIKVEELRKSHKTWSIETDYSGKVNRLKNKLNYDLTFKDYLNCVKQRFNNKVFSYSHTKGEHCSITNFNFGNFSNRVTIQFIKYKDKSRYGFTIETLKNVYFIDLKHNGSWKPWFYKKENDYCQCAI